MLNYRVEALINEPISQMAYNAFRVDRLEGEPLSVVDYQIFDQEANWFPDYAETTQEPYWE